MAIVTRYTPTDVFLPADSPLTRSFLYPRQHINKRALLEDSDYKDYDTHAIFHDVFLDADGTCLRAIGPSMVNLKTALLPITLTIVDDASNRAESRPLPHHLVERFRLSRHQFVLPNRYRGSNQLNVRLRFQNGQEQLLTIKRQNVKPVFLQFTTLQKNNPVEWILDWLSYCHSQGVQRVLLYDNGSDDVGSIETALQDFDTDMEVVLIHWPYKYGPRRSHQNNFTQATQNNHAYQCFGNADWTGHFDIDEFPVIASGKSLDRWIKSVAGRTGLLRFDSYLMPNIRDNPDQMPRFSDFRYRSRAPHGKAHKYILRNQAYSLAKTHNGKVRLGYWRKTLPPSDAFFYHFLGLTTNWRGDDERRFMAEFDPELHVEDLNLQNTNACFANN